MNRKREGREERRESEGGRGEGRRGRDGRGRSRVEGGGVGWKREGKRGGEGGGRTSNMTSRSLNVTSGCRIST